mmetsp:Transcript_25941/g.38324  ORF Transcript_25941/g.38324 Transcript_25941/m.38324 type:complete len:257 (+) Transcript_25941:148-918(+)|eukprot:CAMPEP_0194221810 /NCGR_PEP_ID=MMETSP0156-20130528/31402_1 /TAXON_ID=33649 /ORGANISM="Thalassionema nitzschioides, Strain L26-B" /LENGTH=256 /DNA_ID=CAMNT_0038952345 /DNA_START=76 /DNA_END=849 /DNA_ORIENTATION=-
MIFSEIVSSSAPIQDVSFRETCQHRLQRDGVVEIHQFLQQEALERIKEESAVRIKDAYFCVSNHNVYLTPPDGEVYPMHHPRNREVISSKGLIADDQVPESSPLKALYHDSTFQSFVCHVVGEEKLYPYADPLSAVNVHFAKEGQELGWHFDNSSFAVTLLIDSPIEGGVFEYYKDVRGSNNEFDVVDKLLDGKIQPNGLNMRPGTLVLFRGRNSLHHVTPVIGNKTRMVAVLAYNSEPGIELSESARNTFYGRLT